MKNEVIVEIHPDDILLYKEVCEAMWRVAKRYELPLKKISGYPMPEKGMADRMGDCSYTGEIRLVLRCTVNGEWCEAPLAPELVWDTAAHELAHLRHMNHGPAFHDFYEELVVAMRNQQQDHRQKIISKLLKMQASRQSEAEIGNIEAAESFASAINQMMLKYELNPSELDYAKATKDDPIIEMKSDFGLYKIPISKVRVAWQESLATMIANAHLCRILIRSSSNEIWFVGTKSHATVAEYVFGTLVPKVITMSKQAEVQYWKETGCGRGRENKARGFRSAWIDSFIQRISERFEEIRRSAVSEVISLNPEVTASNALMRLDGAKQRVDQYINDKFKSKRAARYVEHRARNNQAGRAAGREAANRIILGQRGITGRDSKRLT